MARILVPFFILFTLAFVTASVALVLERDLVAILLFLAFVLAAMAQLLSWTWRIGRGDRRLARRSDARRGTATVLSARELPVTIMMGGGQYQPRAHQLQLLVELPGQQPYEVRHLAAARPWDVDHLRPGNVIDCLVHPRRRRRVALLFPEGTTPYGLTAPAAVPSHRRPDTVDPQVQSIVQQATGMTLDEVVRRAAAGEEIPGAHVQVTHTDISTSPAAPSPPAWRVPPPGSPGTPPVGATAAIATVLGLQDLGTPTATGRLVELDLLVSVAGDVPYRVVTQADLAAATVPRLGDTISVHVDPSRPSRVTVVGGGAT